MAHRLKIRQVTRMVTGQAAMREVVSCRLSLWMLCFFLVGAAQSWPAIPAKPGKSHDQNQHWIPYAVVKQSQQPLLGAKSPAELHPFPHQSIEEINRILRTQLLPSDLLWVGSSNLHPRNRYISGMGEREIPYDSTEASERGSDQELMQRKVGRKYNTQGW